MGHSSSRVTRDVYGHVLPAVDEAVVAAMDEVFTNSTRAQRANTSNRLRHQNRQMAVDQDFHGVEVSGLEPPTSTLRT